MARRIITAREQLEMLSPWRTATPWHSRPGDPTYSIPTPELKQYRQFNPSIETPQDMHDSLWTRNWGGDSADKPEYRRWKNDNFSSGGGDDGGTEEDMVEGFESGATFPPVEITTNGHGALLTDGNHRVNTADMLSHPALDSYIHYDPHQYDDNDMADDVDPHSELGRHIDSLVQNHHYKPIGDQAPTTTHVFRRHPETGRWQRGVRDGADPPQYVDTPDYLDQMKQQVPGFRDQGLGTYWDVDWGNGPEPTNGRHLHAQRVAMPWRTEHPDYQPADVAPNYNPDIGGAQGGGGHKNYLVGPANNVWWHGSGSGDIGGGNANFGLHVGDYQTAADNLYYGDDRDNSYDAVKNGRHPMANRTHCPQGHEYTEENTLIWQGKRNCRECRKAYKKSYDAAKRAERCR